jgi:predicted outer membrane repeat protein
MTKIDFDEPSKGNVSGAVKTALAIETHGNRMTGLGIKVDDTNSYGIFCENVGTGSFGAAIYAKGKLKAESNYTAIVGVTHAAHGIGVIAVNDSDSGIGVSASGKIGVAASGQIAGRFNGDVEITGDIKLINRADCAEDFTINEQNVEPGTVMVLTESGSLQSSYQEYDKKVAGIVSGADGYKPGIILDSQKACDHGNDRTDKDRLPIALMGKVYCKVDARQSPIEIGDLLTTSSTKGYAMKAKDPIKAFGTVVGKALGSIKEGSGMIPVLVTLQ